MHRSIFRAHLKKLQDHMAKIDIKQMYNTIMSKSLPSTESEVNVLTEYLLDPDYYNILMLTHIKDDYHQEDLLRKIESNQEDIVQMMHRKKRHDQMKLHRLQSIASGFAQSSNYRTVSSVGNTPKKYSGDGTEDVPLTQEFFRAERAKLIKYFNKQKLTAVEFLHDMAAKLEAKERRRAKLAERQLKRKKRKFLRQQCQVAMERITSQYTDPRITHRSRQALDQIAEDAIHVHPKFSAVSEESVESASESGEGRLHLSDALESCVSWTSCCSKCRSLQDDTKYNSALQRFHRLQEEIRVSGNDSCI
ncbi:hypothetical protein KR222_003713 [Zaprionus bogoriensis]|nr:hypothetical protein KR222_003713 [Zaprionus bogoriensis]